VHTSDVDSVPVDCGCEPVVAVRSGRVREHQCVMGEIVGNSPILVVGGGFDQLISGRSPSPLGLAFEVQ
jgi:hypothetical protein